MKIGLLLGLFCSLLFVYEEDPQDTHYVILLSTMSIVLYAYFVKAFQGNMRGLRISYARTDLSDVDKALSSGLFVWWLLIVLSWAIGVLIGLSNGVEPKLAFRNFFGLVVYMLFGVLLMVRPSIKSVVIMVFVSGAVQICLGLERSYLMVSATNVFFLEREMLANRPFYYVGYLTLFPILVVGAAYQLLPKRFCFDDFGKVVESLSRNGVFTLLTFAILIVSSVSKGYILATSILVLTVIAFSVCYSIAGRGISRRCIVVLAGLAIVAFALPESVLEMIGFAFSNEEDSNYVRSEQFSFLVSELSLLGSGLGASLSSGYVRDAQGYGFELTYLNIIHKLGIFSGFLFSSYIMTLAIASIRILRKIYVYESFFAIGLMGYLVVGAGNPILLSSSAVILHCLAMYILVGPLLRL